MLGQTPGRIEKRMAFPKIETLNLALGSGEVVEVESVRVTELDAERGLLRVEWRVAESILEPGTILYHKRWEGSRRNLEILPQARARTPQEDWILDKVLH